jgi:transposase-like protein
VCYRLSDAAVAAWLAERGVAVERSTVDRRVRRFLPLYREAARAHRHAVGDRWRVDEPCCRVHGSWACLYRAIDQGGQVADAYCGEWRKTEAATASFQRARASTGVTPERVTTDKARCSPPARRAVLPTAEHRTWQYRTNGPARDHGHVEQRLRTLRGFRRAASADTLCRGQGLVQKLRHGCSSLTAAVLRTWRLPAAWPQRTGMREQLLGPSLVPPLRLRAGYSGMPSCLQQHPGVQRPRVPEASNYR